ncbi:hypothetical protein MVEN_01401900 [Mycena venus]|uniref:Uncharacterized protein n=1 Tax=Mycena venus TaxID=2733690 RepID=A0A8H7CSL3_9AGAR|nr:hypothetical protein MVEN_01401900 [Mycena venus]
MRGACGRCQVGECVAYAPFGSLGCYCGHPEADHILAQTSITLPPRGGCLSTGCLRFRATRVIRDAPGRTECLGPGCGRPYISHDPLEEPQAGDQRPQSAMSMVPARAVPAPMWGQARPTGLTTDQNRRRVASHHLPFGPETGASMPRGPHRPYPSSLRLGVAAAKKRPVQQRQLSMALWPFPMPNSRFVDHEYPELHPTDPRLFGDEDAAFLTAMHRFNLIFTFKVPLGPDGNEDKELVFYDSLNSSLVDYMAEKKLCFTETPDQSPTPPRPSAEDYASLNAWHALQLLSYPWTIVALGNKPRAGFRRKLIAGTVPWYEYRISALGTKTWSSLSDTVNPGGVIYFIGKLMNPLFLLTHAHNASAPKYGPVEGPIPDRLPKLPHMCFALHLQHALGELDSAFLECFPACPSGNVTANNALPVVSLPRSQLPASAPGSQSLLIDSAIDSDQEEEQLQQAIALSMNTDLPSSTPVAGPSHRPLPQPPVPAIRPRSASDSSPPASRTRRRLNPRTTTRSPSPEILHYSYRTVLAWGDAVRRQLSTALFRVTAPTTDDAVHALLIHFGSFFGGPPYEVAEDAVDAVTIEPSGEFAPLALTTSWKCGESLGPGVGRTIISELVNEVFSDKTMWKALGSTGTYVINTSPPGIQPEAECLRRLKIYGYVCRLYVISQRALPPPISILFAYALLTRNGDADVIHDTSVGRMYAPVQMQVLDIWPALVSDLEEKKNDNNLKELALQYFDKMPQEIASVSQETFNAYTTNLRRQVLFGCRDPFSQSPEISAFRETFNGRINADSELTLGESFGSSLKSLAIKMAAGRIKSPDELIERLSWTSTEKPELASFEALYAQAFNRYLKGAGRVNHPLLSDANLTDNERLIESDDPLARSLMFLLYATGTQLLPANGGTIEMTFFESFAGPAVDPARADPAQNEHWPDFICPVRERTCFDGVDLPLIGVTKLLEQPIPGDSTTTTDFDLYQYIMYRPATKYAEFGGLT